MDCVHVWTVWAGSSMDGNVQRLRSWLPRAKLNVRMFQRQGVIAKQHATPHVVRSVYLASVSFLANPTKWVFSTTLGRSIYVSQENEIRRMVS